jgi:acetyl/propionyl-CoA carboxylase alpha subunit
MRFKFETQDRISEVTLERRGDSLLAAIDGKSIKFQMLDARPGELIILIGNRPFRFYWGIEGEKTWVSLDGCTYLLEKPSPQALRPGSDKAGEIVVRAPMPAQIRLVEVTPGEEVLKGQTLMILEAMKMEIRLLAPRQGRIRQVFGQVGQTINRDQALVELEG